LAITFNNPQLHSYKIKEAVVRLFKLLLFIIVCFVLISAVSAQEWKFGVMSDTQWIGTDDGRNPGTCSIDIVRALNKEFISRNVKFVIQVGDLVDQTGSTTTSVKNSEDIRAVFAQELFNAGIAFYPLPGNHDSQPKAGAEFRRIYPQTIAGKNNATPFDAFTVPNPDKAAQPLPYPSANSKPFVLGKSFSSPTTTQTGGPDWTGVSYSFQYNNATFILLDQFSPLNSTKNYNPYPNAIDLQQSWISGVLAGRPSQTHAFVFGHKGIITENHVDTLFGSDPTQDAAGQDAFITSLYKNGVRYYIQGHDHMHNRSLVSVTSGTPTDGTSAKVQNLLCASDSSKFYTPGYPSNDDVYDVPAFGHQRQAQIAQELHTAGYYIFTVNGPRVSVDYYSSLLSNVAPAGCSGANCEWLIPTTPALNFVRQETFGYSLNGKEFQVCQSVQTGCNSSYTQVADSFGGTSAKILGGVNASNSQDFDGRSFLKTVDTGWSYATASLASNVLTLWGMADLGSPRTDVYPLSLSYNPSKSASASSGSFGLATKDAHGNWINAVDANQGTFSKRFVLGPWNSTYDLGTYGIDPATHTAWAVLNYNADFAVTSF
jgi:hypothetical protein